MNGSPNHESRARIVFWCFVAIAAFFLITEHWAHVLGALPYLLLAACPLMHMFMHHGHHHHHDHGDGQQQPRHYEGDRK